MTFIDSYPNAERTISLNDIALITEKEYEILKKISNDIRKKLKKENKDYFKDYNLIKQYIEQLITKKELGIITNNTKKEIIIGNILLPDDTQIVDLLINIGYTLEHLETLIRFRGVLKKVILYSTPIDEELKRQFKIYKKWIKPIIDIFESKLKFTDQTTIFNRITELIAKKNNYFRNPEKEHTKTR